MSIEAVIADINGEVLELDASGAAWWPAERTLIVADIHFEKGSSLARRGHLLPPYDTRTALKRIAALMAVFAPARVIALGDSFHDDEAAARLDDDDRTALSALVRATEWIWIEGNHDPKPPSWLGGSVTAELAIGGLVFRHAPLAVAQRGEIAGHLHPCATVSLRGRSLRRRCFASDGHRMVMPAFGAYAGGLDVRDDPIARLFADAFAAYMLGGRRVYAVAARGLPRLLPQAWRRNTNDESQPSKIPRSTVESP